MPPDKETNVWLMAEGMRALVWGGGQWFGSANAKTQYGPWGWMSHKRSLPRRLLRRDVRSAERGNLVATSPPRAVYVDKVEVDGQVYTGDGTRDVMFTDSKGCKVNITDILNR